MTEKKKLLLITSEVVLISLTFTQTIDPKTITNSIKLYRVEKNGNAVEEPSIIKIDAADSQVIQINNKAMTALTQGEKYQLTISRDLKSMVEASLASEFTRILPPIIN